LKFDLVSLIKLEKKLGLLDVKAIKSIDKAVVASARTVQGQAVKILHKGTRTGKEYKRRRSGVMKFHTASKAGEPPKSDSGYLAPRIEIENRFLEADIGSNVKYLKMLEGGTRHMEKRPLLEPAVEQSKQKIEEFLQKAIKSIFK
jgi:HK97 gp10 family phage protein